MAAAAVREQRQTGKPSSDGAYSARRSRCARGGGCGRANDQGAWAIEKPPPIPADDVALLLNVDNLDLLEQMEFYLWLEREPGVLDAADAKASEPPRRS